MNEESGSKLLLETGLLLDAKTKIEIESPFQINELKFSSHSKLIRMTAWCICLVCNIKDLIKSEIDGIELAVKLQYPSGRVTYRPFKLLYPLECEVENDDDINNEIIIIKDQSNNNEIIKEHPKLAEDD